MIRKLFYRRFSKEESKQIKEIFFEESKVMIKRPGHIAGSVLLVGLLFYFLIRAFGPASFKAFEWPKTGDIVGIFVGAGVGTLVFWLLVKLFIKWFKFKLVSLKFMVVFYFFWMLVFGLLTTAQPESEMRWEFAIYAGLALFGWLFCMESIKRHFCEKIYMERKKSGVREEDGSSG